jgi:hypothetical protein
MNLIWNKLKEVKPTYWIHIEDDFEFHVERSYVMDAICGLERMGVQQVIYNRNYGETIKDYDIKGHIPVTDDFCVHDHKTGDFSYPNCHYWPHYSFRPGMTKVNAILKDRMYRIKTKGYSGKEKNVISNNYLLPKIREQVKFNNEEIIIPETTVSHIIDTYCNKEDGVRNLKRCLEIIHTKLNLYRLMKPGSNLFEREMSLQVEFPYTVTKDIVDKLIKKDKDLLSTALYTMYV